jgi:osmoprotectant transport system ATP-binding protein
MSEIVLEHVCKSFSEGKSAEQDTGAGLHPTSLVIESGTFVTILGASGSGKTTLLKLINRLYEPSEGRILINGEDIAEVPLTSLRRRIGYVIQEVGLFDHMTVADNVALVPRICGQEKEAIRHRVDDLLNLVDLAPEQYRDRFPQALSGGQKQRVGLARALAGDPDILLMDEPFSALDAIIRTRLQDELLHLQQDLKKTLVFVTHDIQEAFKLGDKVIIMNQGEVQQYDTPAVIQVTPANDFVRELIAQVEMGQPCGNRLIAASAL